MRGGERKDPLHEAEAGGRGHTRLRANAHNPKEKTPTDGSLEPKWQAEGHTRCTTTWRGSLTQARDTLRGVAQRQGLSHMTLRDPNLPLTGSAKTDPVRFKRTFREGLLKDKSAFFEAYKYPIPKRRENCLQNAHFLISKKGPV